MNDDFYMSDAMMNIGQMIDSAVNSVHMNPDHFMQMFISYGVARQIEGHNPKYTVGMSGAELVNDVFYKAYGNVEGREAGPINDYECSPEYWAGWVLAYCQWKTGFSFDYIQKILPISDIIVMYHPLHEANEDKMVEILLGRSQNANKDTGLGARLQAYRKLINMSQRDLAEASGVNKRTLQQYEIDAKDLSKASASTVKVLSQVLGCTMEDLL